jgi:hypothetical protein
MNQPRITQTRRTFSLACRVDVTIRAGAGIIWTLLTDAAGFPRWNATITRIDGNIREGTRLTIHVPGTSRTFTPLVCGVVPNERMTWTGGFLPLFKGARTFPLEAGGAGATDFSMEERFSGLAIPLAVRSMPDFGPVFTSFADDLRREAERAADADRH